MRKNQPLPNTNRYFSTTVTRGERDRQVSRKFEQGTSPVNPTTNQGQLAPQQRQIDREKIWLEQTQKRDQQEREKEIKQIKRFLQQVAEEEKKRQVQMRKRVEEIVEAKLKTGKFQEADLEQQETIGKLVEPTTKPKKGNFLQRLKKKSKGAVLEAKGAIAKGGG